jgi:hypothetical protein
MNEVTLTLDNEVLKKLIMETIKEKMGIKVWCNGEIITVDLMLNNEIITTDSVCINGGIVRFY